MIEHLHKRLIIDKDGCAYAYSMPSDGEFIDKINELIDEVNKLKIKLEEE